MSDERMPMPPATFEFLVYSLRTQAEMSMGLYQFEESDEEPEADLEVARHSIEMLAMIAEKTKGNLSLEEELLLNNTLAELRFRFVEAAGEASAAEAAPEPSRLITPGNDKPRIIIP